jgi:hypothetical protein
MPPRQPGAPGVGQTTVRPEIMEHCRFVEESLADVVRGVQCAEIPVRAVRNAGCFMIVGLGDPAGSFAWPRPCLSGRRGLFLA